MEKTKILIVDDHPALRHGLNLLIGNEPDLMVIGEAGSREEALGAIQRTPPDFIVLDLALEGSAASGLDLISEMLDQVGPLPILIFSMHDEMLYAERALRAGARGYLMKQEPVRQLVKAIRRILDGSLYVSEKLNQVLLARHVGPAKTAEVSPLVALSTREFEVFQLIGKGLQPREIAEKLNLSTKTVETHRMNIRKKLNLTDAAALIHFAVEWCHRESK